MKKLTAIRLLSVLLLVIMTMTAAHPAYASKGTHLRFDIDQTGVFPGSDIYPESPCADSMTVIQEGFLRVRLWLDENGLPIYEIDQYSHFKRWVTGPNGNTINVQLYGPAHIDAEWNDSESTVLITIAGLGATQIFTIPGYGRVHGGGQNEVTTYLYDISDPENWILLEEHLVKSPGNTNWGGWDIICSYLGG